MDRVEAYFASDDAPAPELITGALWAACHGGQRSAAEYLLARCGDPNWIGWGDLTALDVAIQEDHHKLTEWLLTNGAKPANELSA